MKFRQDQEQNFRQQQLSVLHAQALISQGHDPIRAHEIATGHSLDSDLETKSDHKSQLNSVYLVNALVFLGVGVALSMPSISQAYSPSTPDHQQIGRPCTPGTLNWHTVQPGETLEMVAHQTDQPAPKILEMNPGEKYPHQGDILVTIPGSNASCIEGTNPTGDLSGSLQRFTETHPNPTMVDLQKELVGQTVYPFEVFLHSTPDHKGQYTTLYEEPGKVIAVKKDRLGFTVVTIDRGNGKVDIYDLANIRVIE